jgi:hypothetical protein
MTKVTISRVIIVDESAPPPWENDEGFGHVSPHQFDEQQAIAEARRDAWNNGSLQGIGVVARFCGDWIGQSRSKLEAAELEIA